MSSSQPEQLDHLQLRALTGRYVWWQPADEILRNPIALLWSVLKTGTADDYLPVRDRLGEPALIDALRRAPPGCHR